MNYSVISSVSGVIAVEFVCVSYFSKKKTFLLFQSLCIVFLIISYLFNLQFFSAVGLAVGLFRTIAFFIYENREETPTLSVSFIFAILTLISYYIINFYILKGSKPLDFLYLVSLILYAFIYRIANINTLRLLTFIPTTLSIIYNVLTFSPPFITISYAIEFIANLISVIKNQIITVKN